MLTIIMFNTKHRNDPEGYDLNIDNIIEDINVSPRSKLEDCSDFMTFHNHKKIYKYNKSLYYQNIDLIFERDMARDNSRHLIEENKRLKDKIINLQRGFLKIANTLNKNVYNKSDNIDKVNSDLSIIKQYIIKKINDNSNTNLFKTQYDEENLEDMLFYILKDDLERKYPE